MWKDWTRRRRSGYTPRSGAGLAAGRAVIIMPLPALHRITMPLHRTATAALRAAARPSASTPGTPLRAALRNRPPARAILLWLLSAAFLATGLYIAASTIRMVVACWNPLPFSDQWDELVSGRPITWAWLFSQHNEHRLLFPRLVFIADRWLSGETNAVDLAVNLLIQMGLAAILVKLARGAGLRSKAERLWAAGLVLTLLFWSVQWENFTWGFQPQFFGVGLAAAACLALAALGPPTITTALGVIVLEFVATYTLASGVLAAFLAVPLALWLRRPPGHTALFAAAAVALLGTYLIGYHTPAYHSDPLDLFSHVRDVLDYMAVEIGGPGGEAMTALFGTKAIMTARWLGWIGVLSLCALGLGLGWRRRPQPHAAALVAFGVFVLGMVLLTGAGRLRFGIASALANRYATPALLFWAVLFLLAAARVAAVPRSLWRRPAGMLLPAPALVLVLTTQAEFSSAARSDADGRNAAIPAVLAGVNDAALLSRVYPAPRGLQQLRAGRGSVFAQPWAAWLGSRLEDHVRLVDATSCRGSLNYTSPLAGPEGGGRAQGLVAVPGGAAARLRLLLADTEGTVVGYGLSGFSPAAIGVPEGEPPFPARGGWIGAFRDAAPGSLRAFVLLDRDMAACPLASVARVRAEARPMRVDLAGAPPPAHLSPGGYIDPISTSVTGMTLVGWGMIQAGEGGPRVWIDSNLPIQSLTLTPQVRPDVVTALKDPACTTAGSSSSSHCGPAPRCRRGLNSAPGQRIPFTAATSWAL